MTLNQLLNGLLTAALNGGAAATAQLILDPSHLDVKHTGTLFGVGAMIGVINWLRKNPWHVADVEAQALKKSAGAS